MPVVLQCFWNARRFVLLLYGVLLLGLLPVQSQDSAPPVPVGDGILRRIQVPILMYHYVSELPPDADAYRIDLTILPDMFRAHMQYLHDAGYTTISLDDLDNALRYGAPLPPRPIILTFDDGYVDHYAHVFPVLREFGFTGTFFVITGRVDSGDPAYMNWSQITEMAAAGMTIGSHTKNHPDLRDRDYDFLVYELLGSIETLEAHTSYPVTTFAYPAGRYDDATLAVLRDLPVRRAVTTQPGMIHTTDNRLELPRLRISSDTGVAGLAYLLSNG
ncbi:MAG: polysaccharide deacetylase family protein [Anaerolineaceae bacterium]|nr:polysaccharide deacetylase family protein [Anaerolineaceae bacterium]